MAIEFTAWSPDDPLARARGESKAANRALLDYAQQGEGKRSLRILLAGYTRRASDETKTERPPTVRWVTLSAWSGMYAWQARVARFDELQRAAELAAFTARRVADRETRIQTLQAYRGRVIRALQELTPSTATWSDVTGALRLVTEELRREFGEVDQVVEVRDPARAPTPAALLSDAEVQAAVANILAGLSLAEAP